VEIVDKYFCLIFCKIFSHCIIVRLLQFANYVLETFEVSSNQVDVFGSERTCTEKLGEGSNWGIGVDGFQFVLSLDLKLVHKYDTKYKQWIFFS